MRRKGLVRVVATTSAAALALVALSATAGAQVSAPLTIAKVVVGEAPEGTEFGILVECDDPLIDDGGNGAFSIELWFDATGAPLDADTVNFINTDTECLVTEIEDGGADTVSYECAGEQDTTVITQVDELICPATGPQADPIVVGIAYPAQEATVTVTNTFVEEPEEIEEIEEIIVEAEEEDVVPAPLEIQPRFTG